MGSSGTSPWASAPVARRRRKVPKALSRWKLEHPAVSIRMPQLQKDELLRARAQTGIRLGNLVLDRARGAQQAYWNGYNSGYFRGLNDGFVRPVPIVVPCRLCGCPVPGDARDPAFLRWVKNGAHGGHAGCPGDSNAGSSP